MYTHVIYRHVIYLYIHICTHKSRHTHILIYLYCIYTHIYIEREIYSGAAGGGDDAVPERAAGRPRVPCPQLSIMVAR